MQIDLSQAIHYHENQFPPQQLNYPLYIEQLIRATDAIARYDQMLKNMHNSEILLAPLRNQEAIISSRIEDTISTMDEILKYEADQAQQDGENPNVRSDIIETILYQRALKATQEALNDGYSLSPSLIKMAHQRLLSFGRGANKSPGKFKTEQNYLADHTHIRFVPISPEKLPDGIEALFAFINHSHFPVLIKTALAHLEFEALHPFKDGNGRIGRMLITLMLWQFKTISAPHFYISAYFEAHKARYIDTMRQVSTNGNWDAWCVFFLEAVEQQAIANLAIVERISALYDAMKVRFAEALKSKYSLNALDYVFTNPVFRNNKFTSQSGIPTTTASRFTRTLLQEKIIVTVEEASGRKPALYSFEPLIELIRV